MRTTDRQRAVAAAIETAVELGLPVDDAVVLNDSNRIVVRLLPCDVVARVAPISYSDIGVYSLWADYRTRAVAEAELVRQLTDKGRPVAGLDPRVEPRVYVRDDFVIDLWTYFEPVTGDVPSAEYTDAMERLHVAMRQVRVTTSRFTDRVADTLHWVASRDVTPDISDNERTILAGTLENLSRSILDRGAPEQVLHGEPHQWNVLNTTQGPRFIDFENCCRGPVEYDLAWVPEEVTEGYPNVDRALLGECRGLMLAIIAAHFCRPDNEHPNTQGREEYLGAVREGPPWPALDEIMRRSQNS